MPHFLSLFFRSLRGQLALWFGGLSLLTLLSVGLYVGRLATQQVQPLQARRSMPPRAPPLIC